MRNAYVGPEWQAEIDAKREKYIAAYGEKAVNSYGKRPERPTAEPTGISYGGHVFDTVADAVAAGYRFPAPKRGDVDISSRTGTAYGYVFRTADRKQKTVTVSFRQEWNKGGTLGSLTAMFAPTE